MMATAEQSCSAKSQRVLACVHCTRRKVKCDRKSPCSNCVKTGVQCVPATPAPRQRRRRFPERELLERLRHYEGLLRQNNINFEPLHTPAAENTSPSEDGRGCDTPGDAYSEGPAAGRDRLSTEKTAVKPETVHETKSLWHAMNLRSEDLVEDDENDDVDDEGNHTGLPRGDLRESAIKKAWLQYRRNDHLLFGSTEEHIDLSNLHPKQVQIFRLWQIYLDKIDPLLKVTHRPTLQARIIDAAGDVAQMSPTLEVLMFSIYSVSITSLPEEECQTLFGSPRDDLLTNYQSACQQALLNCGVLRSDDRDCLTALYLYLISVRPYTDPHSLSSMLGAAIRTAKRMGIDNESANVKCTAFEAEMRRRLWWSLIIFDNRIAELSDFKTTALIPIWDCKVPLNVNDSDIRPEMKMQPSSHENPTEAIFVVVRSEVGEFVRHSYFHLDFTSPSLKAIAKDTHQGPTLEGGELSTLEKTVEDKFLRSCTIETPLHFMTTWTTRGYIARNRLLEHCSRYPTPSKEPTDAHRDAALSHAMRMLECDTKLMASPLSKGYHWFLDAYFPFFAYIHIVQDLRKRPINEHAEKSWEVMSDNYEARFMDVNVKQDSSLLFEIFCKTVLQAWEAREAACGQLDEPLNPPRMVSDFKQKLKQMSLNAQKTIVEQHDSTFGMNVEDLSMPMPMDFVDYGPPYHRAGQGLAGAAPGLRPSMSGHSTMDFELNQLDWTMIEWNPMHTRG